MIVASGRIPPPFLIFKGRPEGQNEKGSAPFLKTGFLHAKKCMDERSSHESLCGANPQAIYVQQTRWDCSHSFDGHLPLLLMESVVSNIIVAHPR